MGLKFEIQEFFWALNFVWFDLSGDLSTDFLNIRGSARENTTKLVLRLF